jgi:hypothetical protein
MDSLYTQKVLNANNVFSSNFLEAKALYLHCFNRLPSIHFMNQVEGEKAFAVLKEKLSQRIKYIHQYRWYKREKKKYQFDKTIIVLDNECILELDEDYCEILHNGVQQEFVELITTLLHPFKERQRRQPLEINLIVRNGSRLSLKAMEIKRTRLDLDLFYNDDFKEVDELMRKRLNQKKDKGIVLLHGLPGSGKTTYLRYLVGKIKKRVLFLSPTVADNLMSPDFIELITENPDTVVIIEDAENIIMDRRYSSGSAVSNLLNISDGLLADFLNVQLICTFNNSLTLVDSALMRKGRLIAKYEFGKLSSKKAQRLSAHLGFNRKIDDPMTIAEIANPNEKTPELKSTEILGFRRPLILEN